MQHLLLLSAPRGAGKTTACCRFLAQAKEVGLRVGGILAPGRYDAEGSKAGIDAMDAFTGERRPLATVEPDPERQTVGRFRFDDETMAWSLERVLTALSAPIDVVIIDEIGPLELVKGEGFAPALDALPSAQAACAVLIVRSELLAELQRRLMPLDPVTVLLTRQNRDEIPGRLLHETWKPASDARDRL